MTNRLASVDMNAQNPGLDTSGTLGPGVVRPEVARLSVTRLTLTQFRNYAHARIEPGPAPVVLSGANGVGKTNVLEALSFLMPGGGLRRARLNDVSRRTADEPVTHTPWAVAAEIRDGTTPVHIGTGPQSATAFKRVARVDGQTVRALSVLSEHFAAHWLTPQMDRLFLDGSQERRRFLDRLVFGIDPAHAGRSTAYTHALRERARLLADGKMDDAWLNALEDTMATRGTAVAAARLDVVERLALVCENTEGPFPAATLSLDGLAEQWLAEGPALEVEDRLRAVLRASRSRDARIGNSGASLGSGAGAHLDGRLPHQSDLLVTHRATGRHAKQCSTGEQKMLLVGLILAAARLSVQDEGRVPVLLLDEVAAHLDGAHREALFDEVLALGCQAWFTGTDAALFAPLAAQARFFDVTACGINPAN